ncbi:hypothetical protein HU200_019210 [Digitaria exilis]|uniref:Uncharacterized protein n=1 Tax=Digitaria exilis TaxID=1010633 RepID=A0A835F2V1_9POAL|nr:hypothetical protein HU200_019210 [Digitaria exilis]
MLFVRCSCSRSFEETHHLGCHEGVYFLDDWSFHSGLMICFRDGSSSTATTTMRSVQGCLTMPNDWYMGQCRGMKTGRENRVPTETVYRISRPQSVFTGKTGIWEKIGKSNESGSENG